MRHSSVTNRAIGSMHKLMDLGIRHGEACVCGHNMAARSPPCPSWEQCDIVSQKLLPTDALHISLPSQQNFKHCCCFDKLSRQAFCKAQDDPQSVDTFKRFPACLCSQLDTKHCCSELVTVQAFTKASPVKGHLQSLLLYMQLLQPFLCLCKHLHRHCHTAAGCTTGSSLYCCSALVLCLLILLLGCGLGYFFTLCGCLCWWWCWSRG